MACDITQVSLLIINDYYFSHLLYFHLLKTIQHADIAAVVMQEGIAHICLITSSMTIVRAKIDQVIPRKRKGNVSQHEKV